MSRPLARQLRVPPAAGGEGPRDHRVFWVLKILTTGMGEAMSDFLGQTQHPDRGGDRPRSAWRSRCGCSSAPREYHAPTYWFAVMMVAVFGTMAADGVHRGAGIPYAVTTPFFALVVAAVFWLLVSRRGHAVDPHDHHPAARDASTGPRCSRRSRSAPRLGDLTAITLNLGYLPSAILFGVLIAIPALAVVARRDQPGPRVLGRLRGHAAAGRVDRRLALQAVGQDRPGPRRRAVSLSRSPSSWRSSPTSRSPSRTSRPRAERLNPPAPPPSPTLTVSRLRPTPTDRTHCDRIVVS